MFVLTDFSFFFWYDISFKYRWMFYSFHIYIAASFQSPVRDNLSTYFLRSSAGNSSHTNFSRHVTVFLFSLANPSMSLPFRRCSYSMSRATNEWFFRFSKRQLLVLKYFSKIFLCEGDMLQNIFNGSWSSLMGIVLVTIFSVSHILKVRIFF